MSSTTFASRHIGPRPEDAKSMLDEVGFNSIDELISATIPQSIRLSAPLDLKSGESEHEYLSSLRVAASKNEVRKNYLGLGYYPTITPPVIQRNVLENPGWYTAYTPYQAEIAQGRLEALLNFQTVVSDLTGLEIANASLLDEGTAAAEGMIMFYNGRSRAKAKTGANKFFIDNSVFPQTRDVMITRAEPLDIELVYGDYQSHSFDETFFGGLVQYPCDRGEVRNYASFVEEAHAVEAAIVVAADLLSLALLTPPGEWGADCVIGNSQRFGVPMGFGGPHAAFFSTKESFKRNIPGRIIGVSQDRLGNQGLRMALQTREQHIRREKATSNICTAQALLAVMASMYAVYHGATGIRNIANSIHTHAAGLASALRSNGVEVAFSNFFDTICVTGANQAEVKNRANAAGVNLRYFENGDIGVALHEGVTVNEISELASVISGLDITASAGDVTLGALSRTSDFLTHPTFDKYRSETEMMRYLKRLENRDLSLVHSMISLGSCTMKLNAASELMPITWPEFAEMHPYAPTSQTVGYTEVLTTLENDLAEITGFAGVSLQPNSGAQGEYAGLLVIRAYHRSRGDHHRDICLIPSSAHGTNPASAVMAGMKVLVVKCDEKGNVDLEDLEAKSKLHAANLSAFMITYPSTHGVFEQEIIRINQIIHENGGQVYMDGANMNAQVGLTNPGNIGADVCHLNLHKTFAIPHGGGGPGMGPIGVAEHLVPFLPGNPIVDCGGDQAIPSISAAPWGSALILLISYGYIKMLGGEGLKASTEFAILNANYMRARLEKHYSILYRGQNGTVAHEMIVDCREFKKDCGVEVEDIAKRLIDYGFHAPTVSFPVAGTLMIEPTESESKEELDRFCDALISIKQEIMAIQDGLADPTDNVLKNAPHTAAEVTSDNWDHAYPRSKAAYPAGHDLDWKFWPQVARVDNAFGDRNLICTCPPMEAYADLEMEETV